MHLSYPGAPHLAPLRVVRYGFFMWLLLLSCSMLSGFVGGAADPSDDTEIVVEVPSGTTARSVGGLLAESDVIDNLDFFNLYVRMTGEGGCLKAGRHAVNRSMDATTLLSTLCGAPLAEDEPFTVVEGWRIREIDEALAKAGLIQAGAYARLAKTPSRFSASFPLPTNTLEGYLFPETYNVSRDGFDAAQFIQRQLDTFAARFVRQRSGKRPLGEVVIMGSMIVREEPTPKNRALVAGILWKRIANDWHLGVDATSRYTLPKWNDRRAFLKKLRDPSDPYNTRLRPGLPPTAIGNPDLSSLQAADHPEDSKYWYYLHDSQGRIHPSRSVGEHERYRKKYNVY